MGHILKRASSPLAVGGLFALTLAACQPSFNGDYALTLAASPQGQPAPEAPYSGVMTLLDNGVTVEGTGSLDVGQPCLLPFNVTLAASEGQGDATTSDDTYALVLTFSDWICGDEVLVPGGYDPLPLQVVYDSEYDTLSTQTDQSWFPFGIGETELNIAFTARNLGS